MDRPAITIEIPTDDGWIVLSPAEYRRLAELARAVGTSPEALARRVTLREAELPPWAVPSEEGAW